MGSGRALTLGLRSEDPVLSWIGAMGLALVAGTSLVVDLVGPAQHGPRTLVDVLDDGPTLTELSPLRTGVAFVSAGHLRGDRLEEALGILGRSWPALVIRSDGRRWDGPTVPYEPLYPGVLRPTEASAAVWQPLLYSSKAPGPGPVLPLIRPVSIRLLLDRKRPVAASWIRAWRGVWEMPWA